MQRGAPVEHDLVLVGGGHAHVQVLRRFMMEPIPGVRLSVVLDRHEAVYSGMVPGFVAGEYEAHDLTIDVLPLARRAGARCILAAATRIDPVARRIELAGRPPLTYDVASLDVGSTVRDIDLPGVREHALSTRPIGHFVSGLDERIERALSQGRDRLKVVVVGAGAAGVELALCVEARLRATGEVADVAILAASEHILPDGRPAMARRILAESRRRGIEVVCGARVTSVEKDAVAWRDINGETHHRPCDIALWATGAAAHAVLRDGALPTNEAGFVRVRPTLQVSGHDTLFAAGDCAHLEEASWVPKAGVYAVRQGPTLDHNLRAQLRGRKLRRYAAQRDFLALVNLGGERAVGGKWGLAFEGGWVHELKDFIDRRFMRRFQVLDVEGRPSPDFPSLEDMGMDEEEMACGGCAAKVGASPLRAALDRLPPGPDDASVLMGLEQADDAAALSLPRGDVLLASVDAFRAFTDDPWLVGRVAAVNAASDVLAKGGRPRHAMALVTVPEESPARESETLYQVLAGIRAAYDPLGVTLVGGHSTTGPELFVGLSVTGEPAQEGRLLGIDGLREGDALVLTKPLGTGVLLAADMRGLAPGRWMETATTSMLRDNASACAAALAAGASGCTDVSGFGLAGHLLEMLDASGLDAELDIDAVSALPGAIPLLERGLRSTYHEQNAMVGDRVEGASGSAADLLFDPQTSGGLLIGVAPERAEELVRTLHHDGDPESSVIGRCLSRAGTTPQARLLVRPSSAPASSRTSNTSR
jgi:selenide,water dikinase